MHFASLPSAGMVRSGMPRQPWSGLRQRVGEPVPRHFLAQILLMRLQGEIIQRHAMLRTSSDMRSRPYAGRDAGPILRDHDRSRQAAHDGDPEAPDD